MPSLGFLLQIIYNNTITLSPTKGVCVRWKKKPYWNPQQKYVTIQYVRS